jgi:hypothetical protein
VTASAIGCAAVVAGAGLVGMGGGLGVDTRRLRRRARKLDRVVNQIDQLVNFIADGHGSASVAEKLRGLERVATAGRNALATLDREVPPRLRDRRGAAFAGRTRFRAEAGIQRVVARGRFVQCTTSFLRLSALGLRPERRGVVR